MSRETEITHLIHLKADEIKSFEWIFRENHSKVYGFCLKLTGSNEVSEEITSDVFVRLWSKRSIIDTSIPISALLFKITRDLVFNHLKRESNIMRKRLQHSLASESELSQDPEHELILKEHLSMAEMAINQLPEKQRHVFQLHYRSGLNNCEIAERLNISESTVRVHLFKATQFLRNFLKSHSEVLALLLSTCLL